MLRPTRSLLKSNATTLDQVVRWADPIIVVIVGWAAHWAYLGSPSAPPTYWVAMLAIALCSLAVFPAAGVYRPQRGASLVEDLRALAYGWLTLLAIGAFLIFVTKTGDAYSRVWAALWVAGGFLLQTALRLGVRLALRYMRRRGLNLRHICIVGAGGLGREVALRLERAPWSGLSLRGFYDDAPELSGATVNGAPVLGTIDQLPRDLERGDLDQVWIALPLRAEEKIRSLVAELRAHAVQVRYVPDIFGFQLLRHSFSEVAGMPVIGLTETPMEGVQRVLKAIEDYALGGLALMVLSPLLLAIAIGIKLSSPGPVFYLQQRVTWNGRRFTMLKFRSMQMGAEQASGPVWSRRDDPRTTRLGAWLRRFSLDELPQLLNVLAGEMSLVGPRPERPEFVARFRQEIPGYMQKHMVKAGITGWAQVNDLRGSTDLGKRIQYDLYYIENWSLWFDLRILALTLWHVVASRHAH
ncbi:MAG: undecaprenyl-phosphate glucose phosphotransferase [Betaproteobacteria bacterium]|nr:MAG: undecaprenyl-phosphate glucose phosphotransferase [Betaproteobacteria bacterium]